MTRPALPMTPELSARTKGSPLLLLLDIDGTLSPIAPRPEDAIVPAETQRLLSALAASPGVHVAFVTGRSAADGRRLAGVDDGWVIGNHGLEVAAPREPSTARADLAVFVPRIADAVRRISSLVHARDWAGVLVEDKLLTLSVHYRIAQRSVVPELAAGVNRIANELGLRVTSGKEVLEVRPPVDVDKGTAAVDLAESLGATNSSASLFAAGDDRTDEDMFRRLRERQRRAVTVRVGAATRDTVAEFSVRDTEGMRDLLSAILATRRSE